jgi:protein Mpv17
MGVYGVCFVSPFCHVWYQVLEQIISLRGAASIGIKLRRVALRVLLDQLAVAPVFASGLFLSRGLIAGESMGTIWQTMKKGYLRVIIAGAIVWPPAQMVNFLVVPLPYRVLFINVVGLAWSTYTSFVASRGYDRRVLPLPPIINPLTAPVPLLPYLPVEFGPAPVNPKPGSGGSSG